MSCCDKVGQAFFILKIMNHIYQPTGNSCGPTCIKMVADVLLKDCPTIEEICTICETDWVKGTPPERMRKGLDNLKIKYSEYISEKDPYQSIKNCVDKSNVAIIRTVTDNVPHWIICYQYNGDLFHIYDPWKGIIKYTKAQLDAIWKVRDYFFFEIFMK